jgi:FtsP/CotA-like multicopper oxidase with cupredoxin domain
MKLLPLSLLLMCLSLVSFSQSKKKVTKPSSPIIHKNIVSINDFSDTSNIKKWAITDLFNNEISPLSEQESKKDKPINIDIRAFKHKFDNALDSTWVLGYIESSTPFGKETLPGPFIENKYGETTRILWRNRLKQTMINNKDYPIFTYEDPFAKKSCGGGKNCTCGKTKGIFYPIIYNVKDTNRVKMIPEMLYPSSTIGVHHKSAIEESSYYGTTVHLHGANLSWRYDGYTNSKYLIKPNPKRPTYADAVSGLFGPNEKTESQDYIYPNTFPEGNYADNITKTKTKADTLGKHGGILWYHDHSMMRTSSNVYLGLVGTYVIEGSEEATILKETSLDEIPDVPLMLTDKSFTKQGYLYYHTTEHITKNDSVLVDSTGQPEFYGDVIVVNGKVCPNMKVGKGLYRFRILNTSSSRFYNLGVFYKDDNHKNVELPDSLNSINKNNLFFQIGTEGGFMPKHRAIITKGKQIGGENNHKYLTLAPGERADVLINFSALPSAFKNSLYLGNFARNEPYQEDSGGIFPLDSFEVTNYVMKFTIDSTIKNINKYVVKEIANTILKEHLSNDFDNNKKKARMLNKLYDNENSVEVYSKKMVIDTKDTLFLELKEARCFNDLPLSYQKFAKRTNIKNKLSYPMVLMNGGDWNSESYGYFDLVKGMKSKIKKDTIVKKLNHNTEIWAIHNSTTDTHPIHLHLNRFIVLSRVLDEGKTNTSKNEGKELSENGWKDVVRAKPGQTTYIKVQYILNDEQKDSEGQFLYHCHILEHEDMSMRRMIIKKEK